MLRSEWLEGNVEGLIALSAGVAGDFGQLLVSDRARDAEQRLKWWLSLFPERYYVELQRTGRESEEFYIQASLDIASRLGVPVVATNDVRFLRAEDFEAHEARVCIHEGRVLADPRRPRAFSQQQYLRTPQEMVALFDDLPEAIENSAEIAQRCTLELDLGRDLLPEFPRPEGMELDEYLVDESRGGLVKRLQRDVHGASSTPVIRRDEYEQRLELELGVITKMGFSGYFLIVADFVRWARAHGIPVGPGRGSGTGSLVAYSLGITDLDPIEYELLFERFLNPERISLPDFDIDFCMNGRDRVIDYVVKRYGSDDEHGKRVAQIITFGTMAAKAVVRDAGRVLGYPYGYVDQIASQIPNELGITLERALSSSR